MNIREWIQYGLDEAGCSNLVVMFEWNNRFTRRLGDARWFKDKNYGRIRLSSILWPSMSESERLDTILHEVAHIVDLYKNGSIATAYKGRKYGGGHGPTWHAIAKQIGAKPQRFADEDAADFVTYRRRVTRYNIPCKCESGCTVTKTLITKMRNGHIYSCRKCRTPLYWRKAQQV